MKIGKPDWWPENPYPVSVFPMSEERYPEIVPDPRLRTALSGMLGRQFWNVAEEAIWAAMLEAIDDAPEKKALELWRRFAKFLGREPKIKVVY